MRFAQIAVMSGGSTNPLYNGLIDFWNMESRFAAVHGLNATIQGSVSFPDSTGIIDRAASFGGGVGNKLQVSPSAALNIGTSYRSVSLWVMLNTMADCTILGKYADGGGGIDYGFTLSGGEIRAVSGNGSGNVSSGPVSTDTWYHLVLRWQSGNNMELFVDGDSVGTEGSPGVLTNGAFAMFMGGGQSGSSMNGYIDAVGVWSRYLSDEDIMLLYNSGAGKQAPF